MSRYLDPKADVVFKKIFGQHPDLLKSFLNSVLPLPEDGLIESLTYMPSEEVPIIPTFKYTVVDVKCTDHHGRVFIVEMQIQWTTSFKQRMLFNASKAYVRQLEKGEHYHLLNPVYGLALINAQFDPDPDDWYHHYKIINAEKPTHESKDLQLIFIELPKFKAKNFPEKKLQVLWLRFLSELNAKINHIPDEWLDVPEIKQAIELAEEAAYTPEELEQYDKYWDAISIEKTLVFDSHKSGQEEGIKIGREEGIEIGREEGIEIGGLREKTVIAKNLLSLGLAAVDISAATGLSTEEILKIKTSE